MISKSTFLYFELDKFHIAIFSHMYEHLILVMVFNSVKFGADLRFSINVSSTRQSHRQVNVSV